MKKCAGPCKLEKEEINFSPAELKRRDGRCKKCVKEYNQKYYNEHKNDKEFKEKRTVAGQKYYQENKEELKLDRAERKEEKKIYDIEYNKNNKDRKRKQSKEYRENNKEEINAKNRQKRKENPEKFKERDRINRSKHKKKIIKRQSKWKKDKRKNEPAFRVAEIASTIIRRTLKSNNTSKNGSSIWQHLPYTKEELKAHIENTWSLPQNLDENGNIWMSWENYGPINKNKKTWQIDHVKPQTHSDCQYLSMSEPGFLECWRLDNLQALESFANIKKGNKY